jgi:hypothetical protein
VFNIIVYATGYALAFIGAQKNIGILFYFTAALIGTVDG